ncbi:MAG: hypothetical protein ACLUJD_09110 [Anaerostipes sp.]|uniref:hypothetical protein n=1 Tax=Anaerostipes sp. TaxID=1872530 RepID=UPI0039938A9E
MNLKIKDFGVIKNADIKVDGITVITGNNNFLEELNSSIFKEAYVLTEEFFRREFVEN